MISPTPVYQSKISQSISPRKISSSYDDEDNEDDDNVQANPSTTPRILPGAPYAMNSSAIDWGTHNLIAYGCRGYIVVVDPSTQRTVQTLDLHGGADVTSVRWGSEGQNALVEDGVTKGASTGSSSSTTARRALLASGDSSGAIIVSDVLRASVVTALDEPGLGAVSDMAWHPGDPALLLSMHGGHRMVLWNVVEKRRVGDFRVEHEGDGGGGVRFSFDPFDPATLCIATAAGHVLFAEGVSRAGCRSMQSLLRVRAVAERPELGRSMRVHYCPCARRILFVMLEREVLVFDTALQEIVGRVEVTRNRAPLFQIFLCRTYPELLYCLHLDGGISVMRKTRGYVWDYSVVCTAQMPRAHSGGPKERREMVAMALAPRAEDAVVSLARDGSLVLSRLLLPPIVTGPQVIATSLVESVVPDVSRMAVSPFAARVALASRAGLVQVVDLATEHALRFRVADHPLVSLDWLDPDRLLIARAAPERLTGSLGASASAEAWRNVVETLCLRSGQRTALRCPPEHEDVPITRVIPSPSRALLAVLLRDRPGELWDMRRRAMVAQLPGAPVAATWIPATDAEARERLVSVQPDGTHMVYTLRAADLVAARMDVSPPAARVTSLAWKGTVLVTADAAGGIHHYDFASDVPAVREYSTALGPVRSVEFCPGRSLRILVHFSTGDFGIWNLVHGHRVATSSYLKSKSLQTLDVHWVSPARPVAALSDGSVRILDSRLTVANSPLVTPSRGPIASPLLFARVDAERLRVCLQHGITMLVPAISSPPASDADGPPLLQFDDEASAPPEVDAFASLRPLLALLDPIVLSDVRQAPSVPARARRTAIFYGAEPEELLWCLVAHAIDALPAMWARQAKASPAAVSPHLPARSRASSAAPAPLMTRARVPSDADLEPSSRSTGELPDYMDILLDRDRIREYEAQRAAADAGSREPSARHSISSAELDSLLGRRERAAQRLLGFDVDHPNFLAEQLMACVLAGAHSPDAFSETVRLAAGNLLAADHVDEAVQLLVAVGRGHDACAHLQALGRWRDAAWLAKVSLSEAECALVFRRWARELVETGHRHRAVNVLLSFGELAAAIYLLHDLNEIAWAALLASALADAALLDTVLSRAELKPNSDPLVDVLGPDPRPPLPQVICDVRLRYGDYLVSLGLPNLAAHYWSHCGSLGQSRIDAIRSDSF